MKMNIWILNHYALPPERAGGTRHFDLAKRWVRDGHQATIIASGFDYMMRSASNIPSDTWHHSRIIEGVRFVWVWARPYERNDLSRLLNMVDYGYNSLRYARHLAPPDAVVGSIVHHFAALAAWRLARRYRVPLILEIRDVWPDTLVDMRAFSPYHPFVLMLEALNRFLFPRASHIVCVPPFAAERLIRSGARADRITVIPNFVDMERFSTVDDEPVDDEGPFIVMYTGLHGSSNGLDVVLRAAQLVQDRVGEHAVQFRLVGDGPQKVALEEMARELGLANVVFLPPVPKSEIVAEMKKAHAFIFHLRDMSVLFKHGISPNKLLDYMAVGRPVIFACNSKNNPVADAQAGLTIPPEDPSAMADAVMELVRSPCSLLKQMGQAGRDYIFRFHNADIAARQFLQIIHRQL